MIGSVLTSFYNWNGHQLKLLKIEVAQNPLYFAKLLIALLCVIEAINAQTVYVQTSTIVLELKDMEEMQNVHLIVHLNVLISARTLLNEPATD